MTTVRSLNPREAAQHMRRGEVIAYPTEAVYGLGCDPANEQAVRHLLTLKQRSPDAGLILIADRFEAFAPFIGKVDQSHLQIALDTWPGPVTWLFPRAGDVPDWLAGKHPAIALRVTAHEVCRQLCVEFGGAIVSTSANPTTKPAPKTAAEVAAYFPEGLAGIVAGDVGGRENPSEIRDLLTGNVLRAS
jgi:L-threonylcarbamoyladenylate synthase